jgi:polysaccharide biosynthesis transport protein
MEADREHISTLRDYLRILRTRIWVILLVASVVPAGAVLFSLQQEKLYQASSDVLVKHRNLAATLSGFPEAYEDPARFVQTQVDLARVPTVAQRALDVTQLAGRGASDLLANSSVTANQGSDLLTFRVRDRDPNLAAVLATGYARAFTGYRRQLDTQAVEQARKELEKRIREVGRPQSTRSTQYETYISLVERRDQLKTMEALQTSNAEVVREAGRAVQVRPKPVQAGVLGAGLGLMLGLALAFLWHALDTRLRSADDVGHALGLTLLGRLPTPPRRFRRRRGIATLADPHGAFAEAFRLLRTNLEFVNLEHGARSIMFTSAIPGEGKSTTVANVATAFARAGRRVVLVDLDLRRPALDEFFGLDGRPGLTDVVLGEASLDDALTSVVVTEQEHRGSAENGAGSFGPALEVLCAGSLPPNPGEFVAHRVVGELLLELRKRADLVVVDAPPLLHVGDAVVLSAVVDGMVVVTRLDHARRHTMREMRRVLDASPAGKLGFVLTGVSPDDEYGYGAYYSYGDRKRQRQAAKMSRG